MQCSFRLGAALAMVASLGTAAAAQTKLTIYTALENDQLAPFKAEIEKSVTGVQVDWVRDSTGVITARFLAEKASPKADMVLGLAASSMLLFEKEGLLETYRPAGIDALKAAFKDRSDPYTWTGMDAFLSVVCFNRPEGEKRKAATPVSWTDLTKPEFKDQVVMPHPASSGTGYLTVAAWVQIMGEQAAWDFMDKLHQNIAVYTHSGSAPCVQAAKGERTSRHRLRYAWRQGEDEWRADQHRAPERGGRLGHGGSLHRERHQEPRCRQEGCRLGRDQGCK